MHKRNNWVRTGSARRGRGRGSAGKGQWPRRGRLSSGFTLSAKEFGPAEEGSHGLYPLGQRKLDPASPGHKHQVCRGLGLRSQDAPTLAQKALDPVSPYRLAQLSPHAKPNARPPRLPRQPMKGEGPIRQGPAPGEDRSELRPSSQPGGPRRRGHIFPWPVCARGPSALPGKTSACENHVRVCAAGCSAGTFASSFAPLA